MEFSSTNKSSIKMDWKILRCYLSGCVSYTVVTELHDSRV